MAECSVKIYKRERTTVEMVLGTYENNKTKMVSLKQWNKKCGLLVGKMSCAGDTFVYDSGIELPFEVMEELVDVLPTMSKLPSATNYAELGENKDSYGNEYRTVLKGSEFGGLKICKMKKTPTPVDFAADTAADDDVDPIPQASTTTAKSPHECWTECFDKFYINKNDDWKKIANILRDFCCSAHDVLNAAAPAGIDVVPPTPPATPIEPSKKRKGGSTKKAAKKSKVACEEEETVVTSEVREIEIFL
jgi:hypothetical protein